MCNTVTIIEFMKFHNFNIDSFRPGIDWFNVLVSLNYYGKYHHGNKNGRSFLDHATCNTVKNH